MMAHPAPTAPALKHTPLHALHLAMGARMAPFAGYDMPIHYPLGVLKEHLHTRSRRRPVRCLAYGADRSARAFRQARRRGATPLSVSCRPMS